MIELVYLSFEIVLLLLALIVPVIFIYLFLKLSETAFEQVGFSHWLATIAIFGSFIGSFIDIPLTLSPITSYPGWLILMGEALGYSFTADFHPIYLAINVGGAIVPMAISAWLIQQGRASPLLAAVGVLVVAVVTYIAAEPIANQGIVLPFYLPPSLAAITALLLARGYAGAPPIAYISGTLGTLIGADILNIITPGVLSSLSPLDDKTRPLVLSIGGAGVFDGIFITGIFAVLFAAGIVCVVFRSCKDVRDQGWKH